MELQSMVDIIIGQGVWAGLFVFLFIFMIKRDAEREQKLITQLEKWNEVFMKLTETLSKLESKLDKISVDIEVIKKISKVGIGNEYEKNKK